MPLSRRAVEVAGSATLAITAKAKAMRDLGHDVVSFAAGEPDFDTPPHIKAAAAKALQDGQTKYTPTAGLPALRRAVADHLKAVYGLTYDPQQIVVACGAKHALFNAFAVLVDQGDEVLIPAPYWVTYPEQVKLAGGVPVFVETDPADGYRLRAEAVARRCTPRTRVLLLNSPCNPTGAVYDRAEIAALARLAVERDLTIVSDEIYAQLIYDGAEHVSPAALSPDVCARTVTVNGLSKAYSMTGWRIGYAAAPADVADAMSRLQDHVTSNPTTFAQYGAIAALTGDQTCVATMAAAFAERRRVMVDGLNAIQGVSCPVPYGAFYALADVSRLYGRTIAGQTVADSMSFARLALERAHVAVIPGEAFGADACVRLSYATSTQAIEKGLVRLRGLVEEGRTVA
jgi:aspartate aminotransferase